MKERVNPGNLVAIFLGVVLAIATVILIVVSMGMKPAKLSQEKMQENAAAVEEAKKTQTGDEDSEVEEEGYSKELESFQVTGTETTAENEGKKAESEMKPEEPAANGEYLCSYSSERLLTEADIEELNKGTYEGLPQGKGVIQMVINEMYARYGYQFETEAVQAYFDQKKWYQDITTRNANMNDVFNNMTETEKANVEFLSAHNEEEG